MPCKNTVNGIVCSWGDPAPKDDMTHEIEEDIFEEDTRKVFDPTAKYTNQELEELGDQILRDDSNEELCRKCKERDPDSLPYGFETGEVESVAQFGAPDLKGKRQPLLDSEGNQLYLDFPELKCDKGHRWFKGEGPRRDIRGPNPILFESHLYNRRRREIYCEAGTPDPAFSSGIYNRSHPEGRKINTKAQRAKNGASYYR